MELQGHRSPGCLRLPLADHARQDLLQVGRLPLERPRLQRLNGDDIPGQLGKLLRPVDDKGELLALLGIQRAKGLVVHQFHVAHDMHQRSLDLVREIL